MPALSAHDHPAAPERPRPAVPPNFPGQVPRPARVLVCGFIAMLLGLGACGKKAGDESTETAPGKSAAPAGFPDSYVPPPPEGQFMEIEEVEDRGKTLLRYKVEITNSSAFPKKWFEGAPELPSVGKLSTASRCVIEVRGPDDKVLHQFAEAERDLRMPVWFAAAPEESVPESVRIVIHDRKTKQRYQSEPIALPQPDPTEEELTGISQEEEAPVAPTEKPAEKPTAKPAPKEKPSKVEYAKVDAKDEKLMKMAGKFAEVAATIKEARRTKKGDHLTVLVNGSKFMLFCSNKDTAKVFGEGDPLSKLAPGTRLKVRGKIALFRDQPQIVLRSADQLVEMEAGAESKVPGNGEAAEKEEE